MEKIKIQEKPGKQYESIKDLMTDINKLNEKKRVVSGYPATAKDSANIFVLRIFGRVLAKFRKDNSVYWDMTDSDKPTQFISASIFDIDEEKIKLNFYNWGDFKLGEKNKPIYWFSIDNKTIQSYRLQPAFKKIEVKK